jgi:hypothetical protein
VLRLGGRYIPLPRNQGYWYMFTKWWCPLD